MGAEADRRIDDGVAGDVSRCEQDLTAVALNDVQFLLGLRMEAALLVLS
jgi:hypothetical protein